MLEWGAIAFSIYTLPCVKYIASGKLLYRELPSVLCDELEGCDRWELGGGGRLKREGIYVYIYLIHTFIQYKLTQHCEAIIFQ